MLTVRELIEFLQQAPIDAIVTNELGEGIIHLHISDSVVIGARKPIAYCNRSGGYVYPTSVEGYFGYSIELDEDVFEFETTPLDSDKESQCD
jgi:hypothetical protein